MNLQPHYFLAGDGECARLARAFDWPSTPLGDPSTWSVSLRNITSTLLSSKFPMFLWWGADLIQIYNDAYRPSLGINGKHPHAMGQRGFECWPEIWNFIGPLIEKVRTTGESVWYEDLLLPIYRNGRMEDVYWTFSYSPVYDDDGSIQGVHVVCVETTEKVTMLDEMLHSKVELEFAIEAAELGTWDLSPATGRFAANARLKSWFGVSPGDEIPLEMATDAIAVKDRAGVLEAIAKALEPGSDGKYDITYSIIHPETGVERIVVAKGRAWFGEDGQPYRFNGTLEDISVERRAQRDATEMRRLSDIAVKSMGLGMFTVDYKDGNIEYSPEFAAVMTGDANHRTLTREAFIKHIHPEDQHMRQQAIREGFDTGEFHYTPRVIWHDGSIHRISIMAARIIGENGKTEAFSGTARDITQFEMQQRDLEDARAQLDQERRDSEALFRSIIEQAPIATCLFVGPEMVITVANDIMLGYWGKDASVIGMPLAEAIPELIGQPFLGLLSQVFETGESYSEKGALARLEVDGRLGDYFFDYTYKPLRTASGEIYGVMDMAIDVTEQATARRKLEDAQAALQNAVELAELSNWTLHIPTGTFSYSKRFMEWLGFTEDTKDMGEAYTPLPEEYRQQVADAVAEVIRPGSSGYYENEHPIINRVTGQERIIHASAVVFRDEQGNPEYLSGTAQDVTKERMLQRELEFKVKKRTAALHQANADLAAVNEALEANNRELQQFAYIASHDLQEPVRKIAIFTQMLQGQLAGIVPQKAVGYLEKIDISAKRMTALITDILAFSRLSDLNDRFEPIDLQGVAREIVAEFELAIEQTGAVVQVLSLPVVEAIPLQMSQLFGNLLSNALKYRKEGIEPRVSVSACPLPDNEAEAMGLDPALDYWSISFEDNGIGFEPEYAEKIFNIFQRLHGKETYGGTGIGLALCRKIVVNHGGRITAIGEPGKGSTFRVILPKSR